MIDIAHLTPVDFEPLVGQGFEIEGEFGQVTLTLDNIKQLSVATLRDNHVEIDGVVLPPRQAFALTLEGPREPLLAPRIYDMNIPGMGMLSLFLTPFRQDSDCTLYEVAFS